MNIITGLHDILEALVVKGPRVKYNTGGTPARVPKVDERASKKEWKNDQFLSKRDPKLRLLEFQTLLLTYMMNEDDGKISFHEKRIITANFVQYKHYITKDDLKRIKGLLDNEITLEGLVSYAEYTVLTDEEINRGIGLLEVINEDENRYTDIIRVINQRFINESTF